MVAKEVLKWHKAGYIFGPVPIKTAKTQKATISHFFAVPKGPDAVRPILNLSDKRHVGYSLNSCLKEKLCTVEYVQQLEIIEMLKAVGPGAYMWAKDLQWGYNNVPIHETDIKYLGFCFDGKVYFYQVLPMGLSSSPNIFTEFMHFPIWAAKHDKTDLYFIYISSSAVNMDCFGSNADITVIPINKTIRMALITYYLDDILGLHYSKALAEAQFLHVEQILNKLGLQSQAKKARPPAQQQIWLGKLYDTQKQWVKLTDKKFEKYTTGIREFLSKTTATQHEFLRHIGRARHMGTIYRVLNAFARGLERWAYTVKHLTDIIHISNAVKRDFEFTLVGMELAHKEGAPFSSFFRYIDGPARSDVTIYTDASLTIGIGGISSTGHYFQNRWTDIKLSKPEQRDILWRELCAIFVVIRALAPLLRRKFIHIWTDNDPVKWMLIKMRAKLSRPDLQILINKICETLLLHHIDMWVDYIPGKQNITADALSRYMDSPLQRSPFPTPYKLQTSLALSYASDLVAETTIKQKYLQFKDRAV